MDKGFSVEDMAAAMFNSTGFEYRSRLFESVVKYSNTDLFYINSKNGKFVINMKDIVISKGIFRDLSVHEFGKFIKAMNIIREKNKSAPTILDVGANIGNICIPAILNGLVENAIAIEPHPLNCRLLRANIALNGLHERIKVFEAAAGPSDNVAIELSLSDINWGDHRILPTAENLPPHYAAQQKISVPAMRLDSLDIEGDAIIWMDVQGYEGHVLSGATRLLSSRPPLVVEFCPHDMNLAGSFGALTAAVSHYEGFYDLDIPTTKFRPISELADLYAEKNVGQNFTDILLL